MKRGRRAYAKGRKSVCAEGRRIKNRNNPVISQYTGGRIWRAVEDGGISHQKLLVARSNKGSKEICRRLQFLPTKQELSSSTSREANAKQGP